MNKAEFIDAVANKADLSKKDAKNALESILSTITDELKKGETVSFVGFGTFSTGVRAARMGRIPNTDKEVQIPETTVAKFKAGKNLKDSLNSK